MWEVQRPRSSISDDCNTRAALCKSELNAALDLGKGEDRQVAQPDDGEPAADDSEAARGRSPPGVTSTKRSGVCQAQRAPQEPEGWEAPRRNGGPVFSP